MRQKLKLVAAFAIVGVYIFVPAYRYYALGSYIGYKVLKDKPRKPTVVPKGSRLYNRVLGGATQ